ncbi:MULTISPECIES: TrkA family potassium uptake protein [Flavobacteriaceae]|jgi:voltage-gated potassium channel|uniref:Potassium transporter TrkA n=1 Tax=Flagellimonas marinaquae TaxID=254955 RepID=A0AA48KKW2_9FLAO|nr:MULTISPECIES: potassium channel protein [Allomuricauda]MCA0960386.1 potassium channel protein [Allomuricauda ruestringensis]USD25672.1 potassium channel protein [Allomuricauda aquimarina]BDW91534.1 potassium transporter TrkA [Allomuricauda aquimarina]
MIRLLRSKILVALTLMVVVLVFGVIGYKMLSDFTWIEAIYMTIITVTTVGFSEVRPLDANAKIFTVFLIVTSVFIFGFAISVVSEYILGRNSLELLKKKRVKKQIDSLSGHVVICGFGRNGMQAAEKLTAYRKPFVVIERDREIIERHEEDILFVEGDANEDEVLLEAGIDRAQYLITAVPDDSANLFIVLSARQLNSDLFIISRASQITSVKKLEFGGANKVIMPDKIGGDHMASLVVMPNLITFLDQLSIEGEHTTNLEEVSIEDFTDQMECNSLRDLDLRRKTGCTIIGYVDPQGKYVINPEADMVLQPKSKVIVLGRPEQIRKLNQMFQIG